jgi:hypothetical protein
MFLFRTTFFTLIVGLFLVFGVRTDDVFAANPYYNGTTMFVYATSTDFTREAAVNTYAPLGGYKAVRVVYNDVSGMSANQVKSLVNQNVVNNPSAAYSTTTVGHGDPSSGTSSGLTGPLDRNGWGNAINSSYANNGVTGKWFDDSCGSGACTNLWTPTSSSAIDGVFTSTKPGVLGNDTNYGRGWTSDYGEAIKGMLNTAGKGGPNDADVNHDGVLSGKEVGDYLNKKNPGTYELKPGSEDKPMFFKDQATADKYGKYTECIILRPGQVDNSYTGSASSGDASVEFKPLSVSGYGNRTKDEAMFPVLGQVKDTYESDESQLNFDLRKLGSDFIEKHVQKELNSPSKSQGITKKIVILPTAGQAQEFVNSLGGNANGQGSYTVGGMKVDAGKHYLANNPSPQDKIKFDNDCNPSEFIPPTPLPPASPAGGNGGGNNNGGGQQQAPAQGSSGLESLLPLLMQSLLGGGKGQGQQNNQNQNGAANTQPQTCASQGTYPVCGSNGATYTNSCYLHQNNVVQVSTGVCPGSSPIPVQAPDISRVVTQLVASGAPQGVLSSIIQSLTSLFSHITGQVVVQ